MLVFLFALVILFALVFFFFGLVICLGWLFRCAGDVVLLVILLRW